MASNMPTWPHTKIQAQPNMQLHKQAHSPTPYSIGAIHCITPASPLAKAIDKWEFNLNLMNEILEQWLECQRAWLYLEPIFSSDDIAVQVFYVLNHPVGCVGKPYQEAYQTNVTVLPGRLIGCTIVPLTLTQSLHILLQKNAAQEPPAALTPFCWMRWAPCPFHQTVNSNFFGSFIQCVDKWVGG